MSNSANVSIAEEALNIGDVADLLHPQYAIITGGRSREGCPIITFPDHNNFHAMTEHDYEKLITYLTSVPPWVSRKIAGFFVCKFDLCLFRFSGCKRSIWALIWSSIDGRIDGRLLRRRYCGYLWVKYLCVSGKCDSLIVLLFSLISVVFSWCDSRSVCPATIGLLPEGHIRSKYSQCILHSIEVNQEWSLCGNFSAFSRSARSSSKTNSNSGWLCARPPMIYSPMLKNHKSPKIWAAILCTHITNGFSSEL